MKKNIFTIIILTSAISTFAYFFLTRENILILERVSLFNLCFLILLSFIAVLVNGIQFKYITRVFHINLSFTEWFGLTVTNTMFNYFTPARGGMVARALYMRKRYNLALCRICLINGRSKLVWLSHLFIICDPCLLGLLFFLWYVPQGHIQFFLATFFLCIITGFVLSRTTLTRLPISNERVRNILSLIGRGLHRFKDNTRLLVPIVFFCFCFLLLSAVRLYWAFFSIGIDVHWLKILLVQAFSGLLLVVSITPGNLGIKEGIIGLFARILDISVEQAILGALVDRIMMMIVIFVFGIIYSKLLLGRFSSMSIDHDK